MSTFTAQPARRRLVAIAAAAAAALLATASPAAAQAASVRAVSGGTWGTAKEVPGTAAIFSVSCARAGACSAGGDGADSSGQTQALWPAR
jgi:non-ribosomal peptide synthetase component E (peptide arylation enzyme)